MQENEMNYKVKYSGEITRWDEAIPLGNGKMGCLIWGNSEEFRFSLDCVDIWDKTIPYGTTEPNFNYPYMVKLAKEKNINQIREIFDAPYRYPLPTKLPTGKIVLSWKKYNNISSELDLASATARIMAKDESLQNYIQIESFIHAKSNIGIIHLSGDIDTVNVELRHINYKPCKKEKCIYKQAIYQTKDLEYEPANVGKIQLSKDSYIEYYTQKISDNFVYGIIMGVVQEMDSLKIIYSVITSNHTDDILTTHINEVRKYMSESLLKIHEQHLHWWNCYWRESSIQIPDKEMEKNWYISNYLLASCSKKGCYPMALQGVWTEDSENLPPWKGDYHNDLNTQLSYYSFLKAGHMEAGEVFTDYLWDLREESRRFAESFYHTKGICNPAVMTIDGKPLGGWPMYALSPTNQIWLCQAFVERYRYTGDKAYLSEIVYPYLKETAICISSLCVEKNGKLYLPISSSPEIHDDNIEAFLTENSNYDLALMQYLFKTLCQITQEIYTDDHEKWKLIYQKLPELSVDKKGVLMLSPDESLEESHRHFSHAHAIHPLRLIKYDTEKNKTIIENVIHNLEQLGTSNWVGYSFCWMAELYAIAHNGEKAYEMLSIFWKYFCGKNSFHLNGDFQNKGFSNHHERIFTLEGNMCAADALQEMLMYMEDGVLNVFPSIPSKWKKLGCEFKDFVGENGIKVSAKICDNKICKLLICSQKEGDIRILNLNNKEIHLYVGQNIII